MDDLTPEKAELAAMYLDLRRGDVVTVANGTMTRVHQPDQCEGHPCWVHRPSSHHMNTWPIFWRSDRTTAERLCEHEVGHPDPDDAAYHQRLGRDVSAHHCDDCCARD